VRDFVDSGGCYIGFCAGAHHGASRMKWASAPTGPHGTFLRLDYRNVPGPMLNLLPATAYGPVGWNPMRPGQPYHLAAINLKSPTMQAIDAPRFARMFLTGGPFFVLDQPPPGLEGWARNQRPAWLPAGKRSFGDGKPTLLSFPYGDGKVVLSAYHPFAIPGGSIYGTPVLPPELARQLPTPPAFGGRALKAMRYQSWNILLAALRTGAGEPLRPLNLGELP
jgi:glutamine amidotransferase-like uncharacterized protein